MEKKDKKELKPEEYTRIDFNMVRKILNEYFELKKITNVEERKKLFSPLFRLYLKAVGRFGKKQS